MDLDLSQYKFYIIEYNGKYYLGEYKNSDLQNPDYIEYHLRRTNIPFFTKDKTTDAWESQLGTEIREKGFHEAVEKNHFYNNCTAYSGEATLKRIRKSLNQYWAIYWRANNKYKKDYADAVEILMRTLFMADVRLIENLLINLLAKTHPILNMHANIGARQLGGGVWNLTAKRIQEYRKQRLDTGLSAKRMTEIDIVNAHVGQDVFLSLGKQKVSSKYRFTVIDTRNFVKLPELIGRRISEKTVKSIKNSYINYVNQALPELENFIGITEDKELNESKKRLEDIIAKEIKTSIQYGGKVIQKLNKEIEKIDARLAKLAQDSLNQMYTEQEIVDFINYWLQHANINDILKGGQSPNLDACDKITIKYKEAFTKDIQDKVFSERKDIIYNPEYSGKQHKLFIEVYKMHRLPPTNAPYQMSLLQQTQTIVERDYFDFKYIYKNWKAIYHEQVAIWLLEHKDTVYAEKFYTGVNKNIKENSTGKLIKRYQKGK